ncbi:squalene/phytoene synthase family protein [Curvivirga aplysinae]|uniref:squalene/phytoene synthase family protein n=1 Tax=Curvivirga aplysinae TaxID=2529852 RepID=UPI0012BD3062|nr:squalene/phytoene synthase family protein [Curvivirga aplysinae]MTI10714.1 hypothetical protein [Curvivirga aplysinae]
MSLAKEDFEICQRITRQGGSNLALVSRTLVKPLQMLFAPTYASMRLIDDLVDEDFLTLPIEDRDIQRQAYLDRISAWEDACIKAANGEFFKPDFAFKLPEGEAISIFRLLSQTAGQSNLGALPWQVMASAMSRDVNEIPIRDWNDFEDYSWGATVSPTAVYLYILTADYQSGIYTGISGSDLMDKAKGMGLFCYLVHIARDLIKDAVKADQLLTLPQELLNDLGETYTQEEIRYLICEILKQAESYLDAIDVCRDELQPHMSLRNLTIFKSLLGLYMTMFEKMKNDPLAMLDDGFEEKLRQQDDLLNAS